MTARRSDEAQAVLLRWARRLDRQGHHLRAGRVRWDAWRLGPMSPENQAEYDRQVAQHDPLEQRPAA